MNANLMSARLTTEDIKAYLQEIINELDGRDFVVGDTPVSEQLAVALDRMSPKNHTHDEYVTRAEVNVLKRDVEKLLDLVGDIPVSEQINMAINKERS